LENDYYNEIYNSQFKLNTYPRSLNLDILHQVLVSSSYSYLSTNIQL